MYAVNRKSQRGEISLAFYLVKDKVKSALYILYVQGRICNIGQFCTVEKYN